jgi:hypothetical protein
MGPQRKADATGPRGHRGARGATGATGQRGKTGKLGPKGSKGLRGLPGPFHNNEVLDAVVTNFDDVYEQLTDQMKLIEKMQHQLAAIAAAK